jgi:hypothetical protein
LSEGRRRENERSGRAYHCLGDRDKVSRFQTIGRRRSRFCLGASPSITKSYGRANIIPVRSALSIAAVRLM